MPYRNILIIKLSAIGDVIHALPVPKALKDSFPGARVTWIVEAPARPLLDNNPYIDEVLLFDKSRYRSLRGLVAHTPALARELKARRFDLVLDLQGLAKSAAIALLSGAPARYGYCNLREGSALVSRRICGPHARGHVVEQLLDVVRFLGGRVTDVEFTLNLRQEEKKRAASLLQAHYLDVASRYIVLAPGANWPNKRWPVESFARLAQLLWDKHEIAPVVIGGPGDKSLAQVITGATRGAVDLTGATTLRELSFIIRHAVAFVGGDTGPMHLAAAVGTPVVALFGPTDPVRNGPYGSGHVVLTTPYACAGCWKRKCRRGWDCLGAIPVEAVYTTLRRVSHGGGL